MSDQRGEAQTILRVSQPITWENLAADLRDLGIAPGMVLLVHSSLSAIGWVNGGPVAVIQALMDILTTAGTLVMPAFSGEYSDPAEWRNPPVPREWHDTIRQTMPLFDPVRTPTRGMGRTAELFRTWPDVRRSDHPQNSFSAWGQHAQKVTEGHTLAYSLGDASPLGRIYELDGHILLLGVGYDRCSSLHLAEYRVSDPPLARNGVPWMVDGRKVWKEFDDIDWRDELFPQIGEAYEAQHALKKGLIGTAESRLIKQPGLVDFGQAWLEARS